MTPVSLVVFPRHSPHLRLGKCGPLQKQIVYIVQLGLVFTYFPTDRPTSWQGFGVRLFDDHSCHQFLLFQSPSVLEQLFLEIIIDPALDYYEIGSFLLQEPYGQYIRLDRKCRDD